VHLPACRQFSRGYLRHLIKAEEILGLRLISLHNLHFYLELMNRVRASIEGGTFAQFRREFVAGYRVWKAEGESAEEPAPRTSGRKGRQE
jgi:queuine tRNA-ribosyltransferase